MSIAILCLASLGASCPTRQEIDAYAWLNNSPLPPDLCAKFPELKDRGFYRRLDSGGFEFKSWCDPDAGDWIAFNKRDLQRMLDKYLPEKRTGD